MSGVSEAVFKRGRDLQRKVVQDQAYPDVWWVPSNSRPQRYRVQLSTTGQWVSCSCDYATLRPRNGEPVCSHQVAVLLYLGKPVEVAMKASPRS